MMSEPKRLHPIAIVLNALKMVKDTILPLLVVLFVQGRDSSDHLQLIFIGVYLLGSVLYGAFAWMKFTYRVEDDEIRIEQGIFIKKKRYIRLERIQSIDITEGLLQRLFSLVQVTIDTAGSSDKQAEAVLAAIPRVEAELFESLLQKEKKRLHSTEEEIDEGQLSPVEEKQDQLIFQMGFRELLLMAATSGGVGLVLTGAVALLSQFAELIEFDKVYTEIEAMVTVASSLLLVVLVLGGLLFAYVIATIGILLKYAYFSVKKKGNDIVITRGLLERRQLTIASSKIQAIRIVENIIRQPLGYASVYVETASGSVSDSENAKVMIFPLIKKARIKSFLAHVSDEYAIDVEMNAVPKRAMRRYIWREWYWWIPVIALLIYFFRPAGYFSFVLLIVGFLWGYLSYREAGWHIHGQQLTMSYRAFSKQTYIVRQKRIQALQMKQSWFQRKSQLGTVTVYSKTGLGASKGKVIDIEEQHMQTIKSWYQANK